MVPSWLSQICKSTKDLYRNSGSSGVSVCVLTPVKHGRNIPSPPRGVRRRSASRRGSCRLPRIGSRPAEWPFGLTRIMTHSARHGRFLQDLVVRLLLHAWISGSPQLARCGKGRPLYAGRFSHRPRGNHRKAVLE
jgi:hypothetical protein